MSANDAGPPPQFMYVRALATQMFLDASGYAIYLVLVSFCFRFVLIDLQKRSKHRMILLAFLITSFIMASILLLTEYAEASSLLLCLLNTNTPPGDCNDPSTDDGAFRKGVLEQIADIVLNILADGMLFYRCLVIWQRETWVVLSAGIFFVGIEVLNIVVVGFLLSSRFSASISKLLAASNYLPAFYDTFISSLVIWKLISHRRNAKIAGASISVNTYTSLAIVFFEASLFLSVTRVIYACFNFFVDRTLSGFWPVSLNQVAEAISPLFIILRLALHSFKDPLKKRQTEDRREEGISSDTVFAAPARKSNTLHTVLFGQWSKGSGSSNSYWDQQQSYDMAVFAPGSKEGNSNDGKTRTMSLN